MVEKQTNFVYILEVQNGNYYTGYTTDLARRFNEHVSSPKGSKFTRAFKPKKIVCAWQVKGSKGDALRVEALIKKLSRQQKTELIKKPGSLQDFIKRRDKPCS